VFKYEAPANLLKDKVILVTGAGSGLGRAASLAYAKAGATVVLLGSNTGKLETVYDEIENAGGAEPAITPLNLETASEEHYQELVDGIASAFGRLDGLLNNAGYMGSLMPFQTMSMAHWQKIMQINLNAVFFSYALYLSTIAAGGKCFGNFYQLKRW